MFPGVAFIGLINGDLDLSQLRIDLIDYPLNFTDRFGHNHFGNGVN
jgi:hypothetical protein